MRIAKGEQPSRLFWNAAVSAAVEDWAQVPCQLIGLRTGETPNPDDLRIFNRRWTPMNTDKIKASPLHPRPSAVQYSFLRA
jgi:hypothetical protein